LPGELVDQASPEARALQAVAEFCRGNPKADANLVVEHFQATEFRDLLEAGQAALLDAGLEEDQLAAEFTGAVGKLKDGQRRRRREALIAKTDRTPEEDAEMLRLLPEHRQMPENATNHDIISGSRPNS